MIGHNINLGLRIRAKINSQILSVEAPAWQGAKVQEYQAYSELSQRSQAGCIGAMNVKLFLREPLEVRFYYCKQIKPSFIKLKYLVCQRKKNTIYCVLL